MRWLILALWILLPREASAQIFKATGRYATNETTRTVTKTRTHYLVSESWCQHCPAAKARFLSDGWPAANILTIEQTRQRFGFRVPKVPYRFEEPVKQATRTKTVTRTTQSDMIRIHNSCHGGGQWSWPGDLRSHLRSVHLVEIN